MDPTYVITGSPDTSVHNLKEPSLPSTSALPALASFFGLMSFKWTVGFDCFGCLAVFVFMAVIFFCLLFSGLARMCSDTVRRAPFRCPDEEDYRGCRK